MESEEGSLSCSQRPTTGPYTEANELSLQQYNLSSRSILIFLFHSKLSFSFIFRISDSTYIPFQTLLHAPNTLSYSIFCKMPFFVDNLLNRSSFNFLRPPAILSANILLTTLFLSTLNLCSFPYRITYFQLPKNGIIHYEKISYYYYYYLVYCFVA
jgi:hypothetical protein